MKKIQVLQSEDSNGRCALCIKIDGKIELQFIDGEPEDNTLSRNFSDCYKIGQLLREASGVYMLGTVSIPWDKYCEELR